jgi:hypothetical protein
MTTLFKKFSYPKKPVTMAVPALFTKCCCTTVKLLGDAIRQYTKFTGIVPFDWERISTGAKRASVRSCRRPISAAMSSGFTCSATATFHGPGGATWPISVYLMGHAAITGGRQFGSLPCPRTLNDSASCGLIGMLKRSPFGSRDSNHFA